MLDLTKERILVTGGGGFLGRHVVTKLRAMGCEVDSPSSEQLDWLYEDAIGEVREMSVIIHLAASCGGIGANQANPVRMATDNLQMSLNVVEAAHVTSSKLVGLGSVCAYPKFCPVPFKESDLWNGYPEETNAPYGIAKRALWSLMDAYHRQYGLRCAYLLPANLYGPGDNFDTETSHVIPAMIRKFADCEQGGTVKMWGTGVATRDFLYVEDCADAIIRAAERIDSPDPINIGTGVETHIAHLANTIDYHCGNDCKIEWDDSKPNGQPRRVLYTGKAKELLDWQARTELWEGLRKTVDWYRSQAHVLAR